MNTTQRLRDLGQSLWLDNISRGLLTSGTRARYVRELSITGLTSNPTIFAQAIGNGGLYDDAIRQKSAEGKSGEELFVELALEDLRQAADLSRPTYEATHAVDGWASFEVSPLLANDAAGTIKKVLRMHARAERPNIFIKIPGTHDGVKAIEESAPARGHRSFRPILGQPDRLHRQQECDPRDAYHRGHAAVNQRQGTLGFRSEESAGASLSSQDGE